MDWLDFNVLFFVGLVVIGLVARRFGVKLNRQRSAALTNGMSQSKSIADTGRRDHSAGRPVDIRTDIRSWARNNPSNLNSWTRR